VFDERVAPSGLRRTRDSSKAANLTVRDAGVGLPAQSMDSLFDAFYTTQSGGMGIGLFVSRSIVERHQGRLWAEPNDGPGATVLFPFHAATPAWATRHTHWEPRDGQA
jgi:signal transduction histidine kinase